MKILLVADKLIYNGRSTYALNLAEGLKAAGLELQVCTTGGERRGELDDAHIENFLVKFNFFSFRKLLSFLRTFNPDIIHVASESVLSTGRKLAKGLNQRYLVTIHDLLDARHVDLPLAKINGLVVTNESMREVLVNRMHMPKERIRLIAKGVDLHTFDIPFRELGQRVPIFGCIGRFVPGKGQRFFLKAIRQVLDAGRKAMFLLLGEGRDETKLRKLIQALDLRKAVTIAPPLEQSHEIFNVIDCLVLPVTKAASAHIALEAMAARRPIIASVVGDLLPLIKNEENALATEPGDVDGLANAMNRLIDNYDFARELGEKARDFVAEKFPLNRMVESTIALYEEILAGDFPRK